MRTLASSTLVLVAVVVPAAAQEKDNELAAVQGTWVRTLEGGEAINAVRAVKEIEGSKETITQYRKDGEIFAQWSVVTSGGNKGYTIKGPVSYIYRVTDDAFIEVQGLLIGHSRKPEMRVWKRVMKEPEE